MKFIYNDGGRSKYFKATGVGDCVTRAICNATGKDYKEVYDRLKYLEKNTRVGKHERQGSVRNGVRRKIISDYIEKELGWIREKVMGIGTGVQMHVDEDELPNGTLILNLSHHLTCVKDKVLYDTYDCSRGGNRAVYCYWRAPNKEELEARSYSQKMVELENKAIEQTKIKINDIKSKYAKDLAKFEKKIKELNHQRKLLENKMNREIKKIKEQDAQDFQNKLLDNELA